MQTLPSSKRKKQSDSGWDGANIFPLEGAVAKATQGYWVIQRVNDTRHFFSMESPILKQTSGVMCLIIPSLSGCLSNASTARKELHGMKMSLSFGNSPGYDIVKKGSGWFNRFRGELYWLEYWRYLRAWMNWIGEVDLMWLDLLQYKQMWFCRSSCERWVYTSCMGSLDGSFEHDW